MSHARNLSKASISKPATQSMEANRDSFTEQPRKAPSPTNTPREARGSFDRGRRPSFPTLQPHPLTSGYLPSGDTERPSLARTGSPSYTRGHRRGPSTDSKISVSSQGSTSSVLSRRASAYVNEEKYKLKENIFDASLPADGDAGEIDEATRRSLFKDDQPKKPSFLKRTLSRETLASIAPSLTRRTSRDSTSMDTKPPSLIQRTRKVSGKIANGVSDALQSAAQSAAQGAQNVAQSAQSAAHRLNTHMMSRSERAAQSRRHANHANARAALGGLALRRVQSTSQLDAYTPSRPTTLPWQDYTDAREKHTQRRSQDQSQDKKRPAFSPFSLLKKTSKQGLREVSARNISSPEVTWISPTVQRQLDQDGGSFQLPVPRSSSSRRPDLGPDRPASLVSSVYGSLSPENKETAGGRAGTSVAEHMDRVQGLKNTSVQGRVREQSSQDFGRARAHRERIARLDETDATAPRRTAGTALAASTSKVATASRTPRGSPLAQEVTFPQHATSPPQRSPSTKFPASYAPNASTPDAQRVTMMNLPPPEQAVPSSPSVCSMDLANMRNNWSHSVDGSEYSDHDDDDDRASVSRKPRLRRTASMSDVSGYSDSSDSPLWGYGRNGRLFEEIARMTAAENAPKPVERERRAEFPRIGTADVSRQVDIVYPHVTVEPGDTVVFVGCDYTEEDTPTDTRGPATPTVSTARASAPAKRSSVATVPAPQSSKARTSVSSHASSSTSSHRSSAAALSRSSSQESSCSTAPSVPPKDTKSKPADLRRTPSSSARDKPIVAAQPGSVRDIASRLQGAPTPAAPTKSAQKHTEAVPPASVQRPTSGNTTKPLVPRSSSPRTSRDEGRPSSKTPAPTERSTHSSHLETTRQPPSENKTTPSKHSRTSSRQYTPEPEPAAPRRAAQDPVSAASTSRSSYHTSTAPPPRSPGLPAQGAHNSADAQRAADLDKRARRRQGIVAPAANSEGAALARNETYSAGVKAVSRTMEGNSEVTVFTLDARSWGGVGEVDERRSSKRTSTEKGQRGAGSSRR